MTADQLRGHPIASVDSLWVYMDTGSPTEGSDRPCGHCGQGRTAEGHDGCLGVLPGVMNACCGHGIEGEAYIQFWTGARIAGKAAMEVSTEMKRRVKPPARRGTIDIRLVRRAVAMARRKRLAAMTETELARENERTAALIRGTR